MNKTFDAGLLGSGGGGDVAWWHDYIRVLLRHSHEFYTEELTRVELFIYNGIRTRCKHGFSHNWAMRLPNGETMAQHNQRENEQHRIPQ